jgi:hypothetical protein
MLRQSIKAVGRAAWLEIDNISMAALIQSLKARFSRIENVMIDDSEMSRIPGSVSSFYVDSEVAQSCVGVFASEGRRVTIAMHLGDVWDAGMLVSLTPRNAEVRVNANLRLKMKRITSTDDTQVLYYVMYGDMLTMQRALDCVALITRLFQGVAEQEARQALADMRV